MIDRRAFITGIAGSLVAAPLAAEAQAVVKLAKALGVPVTKLPG